jgi:hypothetical protein
MVRVGDLVEVLGEGGQYWYGEVVGNVDGGVVVNYITKHKGDVWRFDKHSYEAPTESLNQIVDVRAERSLESAWKELGFVYRGDHEIIHQDDVDSESEDEDYVEGDDDEEEEEDDDDDDDLVHSESDEALERDEDIPDSEIANSDDEDEEMESEAESEEESEEESVPKLAKRKRASKAAAK